ncbi:hypothetical protein [Halorussus marinus]|uniref:hypothetical protein n=1 Tax=Halorussus marinus TaxID=2505976 RepID=UPI001091DDA9|nr:hypothetical protein [Halorussus marinus]
MEATITEDVINTIIKSTYITGNPHTEFVEMTNQFAQLDEAWRNDWDDSLGTIPARPLTNRAIWYWRNTDTDRMIVHYMQPHFPSIPCIEIGSELSIDKIGSEWKNSVWDRLRKNELTYERVWDAYKQNLEYVLDDVQLLLENIDAQQVVISADHGNAIGEYGFYGHGKIPLTCVREVPWYEVSATDDRTHEPPKPNRNPEDSVGTKSKLRSLGYLE